MSGFSGWTKSDLEDEVETLRAKLEDAHSVISEALGYGEVETDSDEYDEDFDDDEA